MKLHIIIYIIITLLLALAPACSKTPPQTSPLPKPHAFPRTHNYPPNYTDTTIAQIRLRIPTQQPHTAPTPTTLTIQYPEIASAMHITVLPHGSATPQQIQQRIAARQQRMALNTNGAKATQTTRTNPAGIQTTTLKTLTATPTPVQLLALTPQGTIIYASTFINYTPSPLATDSLMPIINTLSRDLDTLAVNLR